MRWPRRVLSPGESCCICAACPNKVRKKMGQTDRRTPDRYITLTAICGKRNVIKQAYTEK